MDWIRNLKDGNVAIGKMSSPYLETLDRIAQEYLLQIPDKTATTHHSYYGDLTGDIKTDFKRIQFADIWQGIRSGAFDTPESFAAILHNILEMNEVYYSNPKPNFTGGPLYGAAANLIPHRDCILFNFPGIRVYRAIICATDGNSDTTTEFITHKVERQLNKGDYMIFDFDRTLHQVKKTGQIPTPRILLKLHFLALDMTYARSPYIWIYVKFATNCYIVYYRVARYTEQLGTDPKTFAGFFFGILWEYPFYARVRYSVAAFYCAVLSLRIRQSLSNSGYIREAVVYSVVDMMAIYLCIVAAVYWAIPTLSHTLHIRLRT
jgi:hypothetical protein